ncbi:MAG: hypothetical protein OXH84_02410 [Gammaproteobacteria bacterium]|nr:hypothetical protein [Gammaproteobacteria bacterium]
MKRRSERTVEMAPKRHQPTKKELEEPISIDATPEELAKILLTPAKVVEKPAGRQAK